MDELDMLIALEKKIHGDLLIVNEVVDEIIVMQHELDEKYEKVYRILNERLQYKEMFLNKCINMDALVNRLIKLRNDLFNITKTGEKLDTIYHSQDEDSLYDVSLSDNKVLQDVEDDIIINDSEFIDKIDEKKDETTQVDDSESIDKIDDKNDETIQTGDGSGIVDENAGRNNETTQTSDGSEVVDKDTGKNDKKQKVDDSKNMEEKVYNTPRNTRNLFSLKDYKR